MGNYASTDTDVDTAPTTHPVDTLIKMFDDVGYNAEYQAQIEGKHFAKSRSMLKLISQTVDTKSGKFKIYHVEACWFKDPKPDPETDSASVSTDDNRMDDTMNDLIMESLGFPDNDKKYLKLKVYYTVPGDHHFYDEEFIQPKDNMTNSYTHFGYWSKCEDLWNKTLADSDWTLEIVAQKIQNYIDSKKELNFSTRRDMSVPWPIVTSVKRHITDKGFTCKYLYSDESTDVTEKHAKLGHPTNHVVYYEGSKDNYLQISLPYGVVRMELKYFGTSDKKLVIHMYYVKNGGTVHCDIKEHCKVPLPENPLHVTSVGSDYVQYDEFINSIMAMDGYSCSDVADVFMDYAKEIKKKYTIDNAMTIGVIDDRIVDETFQNFKDKMYPFLKNINCSDSVKSVDTSYNILLHTMAIMKSMGCTDSDLAKGFTRLCGTVSTTGKTIGITNKGADVIGEIDTCLNATVNAMQEFGFSVQDIVVGIGMCMGTIDSSK